MTIKMKYVFLFSLISTMLTACSGAESYMQSENLLVSIQQNKAPIIVDVRSEAEYRAGHVPGALHIAFWQAFTSDKLEAVDKNKTVILYCAHGPRAGVAKLALTLQGFNDLKYLSGHMTAWTKAGLATEQ